MKIIYNDSGYEQRELFADAKRENNSKRKNLMVNRIQAKHIPADPEKTLALFERLGNKVKAAISDGRTLVIGFAETATAIGAAVAAVIGGECIYIQTTREMIPSCYKIADFKEEHSHASEQLLYSVYGEKTFCGVKNIVFVDDELTTGRTILNFIEAIKDRVSDCVFCAASVINGMNEDNISLFRQKGIGLCCLVKIEDTLSQMNEEMDVTPAVDIIPAPQDRKIPVYYIDAGDDPRTGCMAAAYAAECRDFGEKSAALMGEQLSGVKTVDVIGTEECMYPAVILAKKLAAMGFSVRTHSTTRSPIVPSADEGYPLFMRCRLHSFYDRERTTYIYDLYPCDMTILVTDTDFFDKTTLSEFASCLHSEKFAAVVRKNTPKLVKTSYSPEDVKILLKDISGLVEPLPASEREKRIQSGTHYCEMLPLEYQPSEKYIIQYEMALERFSQLTADAVRTVSERIYLKQTSPVLVSLARAGLPAGIMIKHYLEKKYNIRVPHYAVSIIRGRGIDKNAMDYILSRHAPENIRFVDGWTGKGAIQAELCRALSVHSGIDPRLAVIADPAMITPFCGTHDDFLIASSCLNSTVSGLISRSFLRGDLIGDRDFHGAAYYGELSSSDRSYEFIKAVEDKLNFEDKPVAEDILSGITGAEEAENVRRDLNIPDINLVKPGIGETTRVLLRRIPYEILIAEGCDDMYISHILQLAKEKNVPVRTYPLGRYRCCGIIKALGDT